MIPETLAGLAVAVDTLVPYGANPRRGDVSRIAESLSVNGQYRPIVVREQTREVLAGNHTLAAAKSLGWGEIAATFVSCDDEQAKRIDADVICRRFQEHTGTLPRRDGVEHDFTR